MSIKDRSLPVPYVPGPPPSGDFSRPVWDELYRIERSLIDLDRPNCLSAASVETLNVTTAVSWQRMLDAGVTIQFANPSETLNTTTGIYTCPQEGIYQLSNTLQIAAFPTPAVKEYFVGMRMTLVHAAGGANAVKYAYGSSLDNVPLSAVSIYLVPLRKGDTIYTDATVVHQTKTGTVSSNLESQIIRISGT